MKIYPAAHVHDDELVGTLKGLAVNSTTDAEWEFEFTATSGKFVAVFESDLNNPVPKKGFDLLYAGMYGASAGMMGGFCSDKWDCAEGACRGGTCEDTKGKGGEIPPWVIAFIVVICVFFLGLVVFFYFYRKKMKAKSCMEIKILRRVRAESSRRPPRHRRDACSMAWRCQFLTARPSQDGHVIAEK